ncbi:hypothetical protein [Chitinophaga filiformis]|uniref:Helix-turn-helix domain-containing protein n=1 Tax=Chitinophaga filiformis TaxID=104663 RepID=A0ABY4I9B7_CHIFI|nr:hypothetical protein [Chitinophaga filiformis]UPK72697.1 hypothetical protein MYF79_15505 [Chitinophaga filiformis]
MENNLETDYIQRCLQLVERRFDRGPNSEWSSYDFEKLSDAIQEATGVVLSITTLKRLWGKLSYTNTPAVTTLNTLARYAGYEDWGTFRRKLPAERATPVTRVAAAGQATDPTDQFAANAIDATAAIKQPADPTDYFARNNTSATTANRQPADSTDDVARNTTGATTANRQPADSTDDVARNTTGATTTAGKLPSLTDQFANTSNGIATASQLSGPADNPAMNTIDGDAAREQSAAGLQSAGAPASSANGNMSAAENPGHSVSASAPQNNTEARRGKTHPSGRWPYWALGLLSLAIILYVTLLSNGRSKQASTDPGAYQFSSNKTVTTGVPNSVIFKYDASAAGDDSVFISQSWDVSRKFAVPKDRTEYSSIYYLPGYFRAKLIAGKQIVKEHDLMISSDGWLAAVEQEKVPVYFRQQEFLKGHTVEVDAATMQAYNISLQPAIPMLRFYYVKDMGSLRTDNFSFETSVKSNFNQGSAACQRVQILILCKNDVFFIPLCTKGCVGDLLLVAGGKAMQSKNTDLSKFGRDMSRWVQLKVEAKDKHIRILVDGDEAAAFTGDYQPTDIVGVQYRFEGPGAVKDTRFINGNKVIAL